MPRAALRQTVANHRSKLEVDQGYADGAGIRPIAGQSGRLIGAATCENDRRKKTAAGRAAVLGEAR
ncbi:hypothetical protein C6P77_19140 [Burkholderia ambifaria]|nr:hypothetical protein C6P77_19140 [Burkholderia ambifaria]